MRKVFEVELGAQSGNFTQLTLPAAPYALLDALEKLRLEDGEIPTWTTLSIYSCEHITDFIDKSGTLFELDALCQQLALLDDWQLAIVEGLVRAEYERDALPTPLPKLIDMAYSTGCCHLVEKAIDDCTLGRFCAENGFVPRADELSDEVFKLLDFEKIGQEFRWYEGGVFTSGGYVQKHDELRQAYDTLDLTPKKPDYAALVQTASGCEVRLPVPLGSPTGDEPVLCLDCAAPSLIGLSGTMATWDFLAHRLAELEVDGELPKFKAVLEATDCDEIGWALTLADGLDRYSFDRTLLDREGLAKGNLSLLIAKPELELLLPHVNLSQYGQTLLEADCGVFTEYGLVERNDGEPIHRMEQESVPGGMEMT